MEPTHPTVVYTIETSVTGVKKRGADWFIFLQGFWIGVNIGSEFPEVEVGDKISVSIRKAHAKDSGTSIQQSS